MVSTATSTSLDMRGKIITTFIAYAAARRLAELAEGRRWNCSPTPAMQSTTTYAPGAGPLDRSLPAPSAATAPAGM
jgi:hypothetical protein